VGQLVRDLSAGGGVYQTAFTLIPSQIGAPVFPKALAAVTSVASNLTNAIYAAAKFRNPYTLQGTIAIERRLTRFMALAVSYLESRGNKLWSAADQNLAGATILYQTYTINDTAGNPTGTYGTNLFATNFGQHFEVGNEASSRYKGATAQLRTAPLRGLSLQASYTWSHAYDDVSAPPIIGGEARATTSVKDYAGDWGPSAFDQRNRFVLNWMWKPRVTGSNAPAARLLLNGWQVSGIASAASSMRETALVDVIGQQFSKFTMAFPTSLNGSGGWSRVPFYGVNTLPIGATYNVDARVTKELAFTERLKATLMFEAYNAANRKNDTSVQTMAFTAVGGVLKPVAGLGTPNASYGYPFGTNARRLQVALRLSF
jgi:hypothetical protein